VELTSPETRILGCLVEKQLATPNAYPLTLNSLITAANQATNRDPVVTYDESEVVDALQALRKKGAYPCAFNAADEVAVEAFLERRIPFSGIAEVIERVLTRTPKIKMSAIGDVLTADSDARRMAREEVEHKAARTAVA